MPDCLFAARTINRLRKALRVLRVISHLQKILRTQVDFLLFRPIKPDLEHHFTAYFLYIILVTLAVGVGRYWDHLDAEPWQYFGLGSVAYIFVLSAFLYLILKPLKPQNWSYRTVLIFVGFTSLPALLYATPVERFFTLSGALSSFPEKCCRSFWSGGGRSSIAASIDDSCSAFVPEP